ncbi:ABC transporter permease [Aerosakkonema sp. BLCC-F183]|uniref:ABC transporter permease n=1 Tax=Aerosakkonema sp. BLCC-F183 TaxID=3342834 RepID=UPI0035B8F07C
MKVNSAASQLYQPKKFIKLAVYDLKKSFGTAKSIFLQGIAQQYRYSTLGLFWAFIPCLVTAALLTLGERSRFLSAHKGAIPPQLYGIFGLIMAQTFLEALNNQRTLFSNYRHLLSRQKFPMESLVLASLGQCIFGTLVRLAVLVLVFIIFLVTPATTAPLVLICLGLIVVLGTGIGLWLAPWNALSRDLENIMNFFPWILFAITPVFVPVSSDGVLYRIYQLNPLTHIFEAARWLAYGSGEFNIIILIVLLPVSIILLLTGWWFCRLCLPYVMERSLI